MTDAGCEAAEWLVHKILDIPEITWHQKQTINGPSLYRLLMAIVVKMTLYILYSALNWNVNIDIVYPIYLYIC